MRLLDAARREWEAGDKRLQLIARALLAITPFLEFPALVHEQVTGLIETLDQGTRAWLERLYRPHYLGGPGYSGFDPTQETGVGLRAGIGDLRVPAHHVMNASLLRACVWAFLFSLCEHVRRHAGGLDCLLLDDPQTHFDSINSENLATAVPAMPEHGIRPIVATNDTRFMAAVQNALPHRTTETPSWTALQLNPISKSRFTAAVSPAIDEIRDRRDRWREDENDTWKAQAFVEQVRLDVENRLWNLLATDPIVLHKPTLGDLLNGLRGARSRGERPFDEKPFELLLTNQNLRDSARFYHVINKAHHRKSDVGPADAADVDKVFEGIDNLLRSCTASYARFMGRLTREDEQLFLLERPNKPTAVALEAQEIPVLGRLAARSTSDMLAETEQIERFDLSALGPVAFYSIRASTLGWLALSGQTVIVAPDREARDGDPVVALFDGRVYTRRLGRDERDPSRIALLADRSGTENVPPTLVLPRARTLVMPIVGVLFDTRRVEGRDEAVQVDGSPLLADELHGARVVEDSAHPIIRDGDMVLMKPLVATDRDSIGALEGAIVAAIASRNGETFGFLKRVGQEMNADIRIFESVGLNGASVGMTISGKPETGDTDAFALQRLWLVQGVLRLSGR